MAAGVARSGPDAAAVELRVSFDSLFELEHARLLQLAFLVAGDHHRAEDAVAEAFARTFPQWQRGRVVDGPAYLRTAVVNELRRRGRRSSRERQEADRRRREPEAAPFDGAAVERDALVTALQLLPLRQRAAVVLRYFDDRSEAETAALLGLSVGTVKTHVHRGLARLRTLLEEER